MERGASIARDVLSVTIARRQLGVLVRRGFCVCPFPRFDASWFHDAAARWDVLDGVARGGANPRNRRLLMATIGDGFKDIFLAGIGAMAVTAEKGKDCLLYTSRCV